MKRKLPPLLVCLLVLSTIPIATGMMLPEEQEPSAIGRTVVRGFFLNYRSTGFTTRFFAIRIHYTEVTGLETSMGVVRFRWVDVGRWTGGYIRAGPLGAFGYMGMATFRGGIEIS